MAGFLAIAALAIVVGRRPAGSSIVYGASLIVAAVGLANALFALAAGAPVTDLTLPFGLPLLGAHFRLDALSAFFLLVVNIGGCNGEPLRARLWPARIVAAAHPSLFPGLSGGHESRSPRR